jgi:hypothetical protein
MAGKPSQYFVAWWEGGKWGEVSEPLESYDLASKWLTWKRGCEDVRQGRIRSFGTEWDAKQYTIDGRVRR